MLLRYTVNNFKSIGEPIEISMLPIEDSQDHSPRKSLKTKHFHWEALQRAAIFGPNNTGKSALLESMAFARDLILSPLKPNHPILLPQCKVYSQLEDSSFQFVFFHHGVIYDYGFSCNHSQINEEWLYLQDSDGDNILIFEHDECEDQPIVRFGNIANTFDSKRQELLHALEAKTIAKPSNQLLLYTLYDHGFDFAKELISWFKNLICINPRSKVVPLPLKQASLQPLCDFMADQLKLLDTSITHLKLSDQIFDLDDLSKRFNLSPKVIHDINKAKSGMINLSGHCFLFARHPKESSLDFVEIYFVHRFNDKDYKFSLSEESHGMQQLVEILPLLYIAEHSPTIFVVDELDRSLHTKLNLYLIAEFAKRTQNQLSQLLFTAQDLNLISFDYLSQDEIWLVSKSEAGTTKLNPLTDFDLCGNQDQVKEYLSGSFGAIPKLG